MWSGEYSNGNCSGMDDVMSEALRNLLDNVFLHKSCFELAEEYRRKGRTPSESVQKLINSQCAKAAGTGFLFGLPGLALSAVTISADMAYATRLHSRMVRAIALLYGWDPESECFRTATLLSLLGGEAADTLRRCGVQVGTKVSARLLAKMPGRVLIEINKAVGIRLITKAGTKGVVNLNKLIPFVGGLVSGSFNGLLTRQVGLAADRFLRCGPGDEGDDGYDHGNGGDEEEPPTRPRDPFAGGAASKDRVGDIPELLPPAR
jgi:hypothetical protein